MHTRILNGKISIALPRSHDFGANSGVGGLQYTISQVWPVFPNLRVKRRYSIGFDVVIKVGNPLDIWTKPSPSTQI